MANYDFTYTGAEIQEILDTAKKLKDSGYIFLGVATPSTNPGTPTQKVYYEAKQAGTYTNFGGVVLPDGISLLIWNGSWTSETVMCGDGGVFDISVYKSTGGTLATYADLSAALDGGNNIPVNARKGGMSVKFVQSSDNKYVQFRCIADEFTIDVTQWAIAEEGVYVDNPEFVYVKTDAEDRILWAIKTDGGIYYGAGVPQQVKDYIEEKIADLSLDEYEDIVAFLSDYLGSDTTLKTMIDGINDSIFNLSDTKVDKVEGKSLIDAEYASSQSTIENSEFIEVTTDSDDKILEGIKTDGTKVIGSDVQIGGSTTILGDSTILGKVDIQGTTYTLQENPEWIKVLTDAQDRIIAGVRKDGSIYLNSLTEIPSVIQQAIDSINTETASLEERIAVFEEILSVVDNPEFIQVTTDSEGKVLQSRTPEGVNKEYVGIETPKVSVDGATIENIQDLEGRTEIKTDSEGKILSYRDSEGVMHEGVGIETNHLRLTKNGIDELQQALKDGGYIRKYDWSDENYVELPLPSVCAVVNLGVASQATAKGVDIETTIEYWDKLGNYFKKPILLNAQGSSSLGMIVKNQAIDINDGSKIKFGNWLAFDSFHIKKYYIDVFRGQCIVCYRLGEQVYKTRPIMQQRPWSYLQNNTSVSGGYGDFAKDFDSGAMAHPDGFPVHLFFNGKDAGIYAFNIKKDRSNYNCKKTKATQNILDGVLGTVFFMANGDLTATGDGAAMIWDNFEIRNPKSLVYATEVNGSYKYDADVKEAEIAGNNGMSTSYDDWSSSVTNYSVGKVVKHNNHYYLNTVANNVAEPILQDGNGNKNTDDSPDFKNKTKCGWINCTLSVNAKHSINRLTTALTAVNAETTTDAKKTKFEEFFNVPFLIDYDLIGQIVYHYDGYRKNWIWLTNDGLVWAPTIYDMDSVFGQSFDGASYVNDSTTEILGTSNSLPTGIDYLKKAQDNSSYGLYWNDVKLRYKELRDAGIFTADNICKLLDDWLKSCGYDNLKNDIENIVVAPYYENGNIVVDNNKNPILVPCTPSYRDGSKTYDNTAISNGGWYNSVQRVYNWLVARIATLDTYYEYSNN